MSILIKKLFFFLNVFFKYLFSASVSLADLQKNLINKLTATQTLTFDFKQKIADKEEIGNCFVKYPLRMKCNYKNSKGKTIILNLCGRGDKDLFTAAKAIGFDADE